MGFRRDVAARQHRQPERAGVVREPRVRNRRGGSHLVPGQAVPHEAKALVTTSFKFGWLQIRGSPSLVALCTPTCSAI